MSGLFFFPLRIINNYKKNFNKKIEFNIFHFIPFREYLVLFYSFYLVVIFKKKNSHIIKKKRDNK